MLTKRLLTFFTSIVTVPSLVIAQTSTQRPEPQQLQGSTGIFVYFGDGLNVGARFSPSSALVLRPSIGVNWTKEKMPESLGQYSAKSVNLAIEILSSGAADLTPHLPHPYYGGGLRFSYSEFKTEYPPYQGFVPSSGMVSRFLALRGFGGASFWMNDRFSFFGEVGFSVGDDPSLDGRNFNFSTFSQLGMNFVF